MGEVQGRTPTQWNSTAQHSSSEQIMYRSVVQVNSERARPQGGREKMKMWNEERTKIGPPT